MTTNKIMFLTGVTNELVESAPNARLGLLVQPGNSYHLRVGKFPAWAIDNGCFSKGDRFDLPGYLDYLASVPKGALFATAPDVVGDAAATLKRSLPVLGEIRARGHRAAFVGQDGATADSIPWTEIDAFFVGGSTAWKLGTEAAALVKEARARGKWVHMGRVNSKKRLSYAESIGCDSVDGTYLKFGCRTNLPKLISWLN